MYVCDFFVDFAMLICWLLSFWEGVGWIFSVLETGCLVSLPQLHSTYCIYPELYSVFGLPFVWLGFGRRKVTLVTKTKRGWRVLTGKIYIGQSI